MRDKKAHKPATLFSKGTNGKFYEENGKISGSSFWFKFSYSSFIVTTMIMMIFLSSLLNASPNTASQDEALFLDKEWKIAPLIPELVSYIGWLYVLPLIFGIIGYNSKKYSVSKPVMFIISASICCLIVWVLCLLVSLGFLI